MFCLVWLKIAIFPSVRGATHWNIAIRFGTEKLEWCGKPTVKNFTDMIRCFDTMHKLDRRTPHDTTCLHPFL